MKACGVNVVSTYIFWIHHEESKGRFDFSGRREPSEFVRLCGELGLYVILRLGPFNHGEVRNGGVPDWVYGCPFGPAPPIPVF
jgi:beta-galactosidase GanA